MNWTTIGWLVGIGYWACGVSYVIWALLRGRGWRKGFLIFDLLLAFACFVAGTQTLLDPEKMPAPYATGLVSVVIVGWLVYVSRYGREPSQRASGPTRT